MNLSYSSTHADRVRLTAAEGETMRDRLSLTAEDRSSYLDGQIAHNYLHLTEPAARDTVSLILTWLAGRASGLDRAVAHLPLDTRSALRQAIEDADAADYHADRADTLHDMAQEGR